MTRPFELVVHRVRGEWDGLRDIGVVDGLIAAITPSALRGAREIDAAGGLAIAPFADAHVHLDKVLHEEAFTSHVPTTVLLERVRIAREAQRRAAPVAVRARRLIDRVRGYGTAILRSHVDVDLEGRLDAVETLLALREEVRDRCWIQLIAFPQDGLLIRPGVDRLLRDALAAGCDGVGGLDPGGVDGDVEGHLTAVLDLAAEFGTMVDIHLHDDGLLGLHTLRVLARKTRERGLEGCVAASHCFCLASGPKDQVAVTLDDLAAARIAVIVNPRPVPRPLADPAELAAHGVEAAIASDNIQDAWWPYGDGDLLHTLNHGAQRWRWTTPGPMHRALDFITTAPRRILGLPPWPWTLAEGEPASFLLLHAETLEEALIEVAPRMLVWNGTVAPEVAGPAGAAGTSGVPPASEENRAVE